jgi:hypothetical protein
MNNTPNKISSLTMRIVPPGIVAIALVIAWRFVVPGASGDSVEVVLKSIDAVGPLDQDGKRIVATFEDRQKFRSLMRPEVTAYTWTFNLDRAGGKFVVSGMSGNEENVPAHLIINRVVVSRMALYQSTGSVEHMSRFRRIGSSVSLQTGSNQIRLEAANADDRAFVLRFQEVMPLWSGANAAIAIAIFLGLILLDAGAGRYSSSPRGNLLLSISTTAICLLLAGTYLAVNFGSDLVGLGKSGGSGSFLMRMHALRDYVSSDTFATINATRFTAALFGDSTHFHLLPEGHHMLQAAERALTEKGEDEIAVFGTSMGGMMANEFSIMTMEVADQHPDMVVIPVNLHFMILNPPGNIPASTPDGHIGFREYLVSVLFDDVNTNNSLEKYLFRKLDAIAFDDSLALFKIGLTSFIGKEWKLVLARLTQKIPGRHASFGMLLLTRQSQDPGVIWDTTIGADNIQMKFFHKINRLAEYYNFDVLYYSVQLNESYWEEQGHDLRLKEQYSRIRDIIATDPRIHFLDLSDYNPPEFFADNLEHLTPAGSAYVAGRLVDEIVRIHEKDHLLHSTPN